MAESKAPAGKTAASTKPKADPKPADDSKTSAMPPIQVCCARGERFCRAGRCFGKNPETVTDYTPEQRAAWEAEPSLVVTVPPGADTAS